MYSNNFNWKLALSGAPEDKDFKIPAYACPGCNKTNLTPFLVHTCEHCLCGPCWQVSAMSGGELKNECLVCGKQTELVHFPKYRDFVAHNVYIGELYTGYWCDDSEKTAEIKWSVREKIRKARAEYESVLFYWLTKYCMKKRHDNLFYGDKPRKKIKSDSNQ